MPTMTAFYEKKWPGPIQYAMENRSLTIQWEFDESMLENQEALMEKAGELLSTVRLAVEETARREAGSHSVQVPRLGLTDITMKRDEHERFKAVFGCPNNNENPS